MTTRLERVEQEVLRQKFKEFFEEFMARRVKESKQKIIEDDGQVIAGGYMPWQSLRHEDIEYLIRVAREAKRACNGEITVAILEAALAPLLEEV